MQKSILLYVVILFVLTNIFTYMFLSSQVKFEQNNSDKVNKKFTDTVVALTNDLDDANYFSLDKNQNAQDYFENKQKGTFISADKIIPFVSEKLKDLNGNEKGNPYTGQDPIDGKKFIINKIKILNHRWIIADFNNGDIWGEVLIKYFLEQNGTVTFITDESVLYPKS